MDKYNKYYPRIRDLREDKDLTQEQLSRILNLTNQQAYSRYENGSVEMPIRLFIDLAKFYNVSLDYITGLTNDKRKLK